MRNDFNFLELVISWAMELSPRSSTVESAETSAAAAASIENDDEAPPLKITKVSSIRAKYLLKKHQSASHSKSSTCNSIRDQMEKYLNYDHGELISKNNEIIEINPMQFWADVNGQMPALAKLARLVLSVPASSAPVERVFSHGGIIFRPHRRGMSDSNLSQLIYLKCNRLK